MQSTTFSELNLNLPILRALDEEKYSTPTPIQAQAIPHLLAGRDLMGCAQTGTGKTAAFALPILQHLDKNRRAAAPRSPRVLILAPTRELASQIHASIQTYGRHLHFRSAVIYGGVGQTPQVRALSRGVHILVATPGRLLDLIQQKHLRLDQLEIFVLDEADRMLDMGFLPDIKRVIAMLPAKRQSLLFSATMQDRDVELAHSLLNDPVRVTVTPASSTVERIQQRVMFVDRNGKRDLLKKMLGQTEVERVLVFTKTKRGADVVAERLGRDGIVAHAIHGGKTQGSRERVLQSFRMGKVRVLVATDIAARGIDVDGITHVINYDMPIEPECYVHRIGRTGRAGAEGIAFSFCDSTERSTLRAIERLTRQNIPVDSEYPDPSPRSESREGTGRPAGRGPVRAARPPFKRRGPRPAGPKPSYAGTGEVGSATGEATTGKPRRKRPGRRQPGKRPRQTV